jgi:heme oxygenase
MSTRPPVLDALKRGTRRHHDRVEAQVRVLEPDFTPGDYETLLVRMWGFYQPVEAGLAGCVTWGQLGLDSGDRWKVSLLERDLAGLGKTADALAKLPVCTDLPALNSVPAALGCMYVLEGATLGGAIIARHLARTWKIRSAFFGSYGSATGARWQEFGRALASYEARTGSADLIVNGACETFDKLHGWLLKTG